MYAVQCSGPVPNTMFLTAISNKIEGYKKKEITVYRVIFQIIPSNERRTYTFSNGYAHNFYAENVQSSTVC